MEDGKMGRWKSNPKRENDVMNSFLEETNAPIAMEIMVLVDLTKRQGFISVREEQRYKEENYSCTVWNIMSTSPTPSNPLSINPLLVLRTSITEP